MFLYWSHKLVKKLCFVTNTIFLKLNWLIYFVNTKYVAKIDIKYDILKIKYFAIHFFALRIEFLKTIV